MGNSQKVYNDMKKTDYHKGIPEDDMLCSPCCMLFSGMNTGIV